MTTNTRSPRRSPTSPRSLLVAALASLGMLPVTAQARERRTTVAGAGGKTATRAAAPHRGDENLSTALSSGKTRAVPPGRRSRRAIHRWMPLFLSLALIAGAGAAPQARRTLMYQGLERSYVVRVPPLPPDERRPLVLVLHGGGGNAAVAEAMTGFTDKAMREGFIVAYPEGTGRVGNRLLTWNAGHCCGQAMTRRVDDVGFIRALISRLEADHPVDPRRIYVTGMSNGGMMSHRLGIELSDRIAAIAPVVAAVFGDEQRPSHAVAALMINGQLDGAVPPAGGAPGGRFPDAWDGTPVLPASAQGSFWATANGCEAAADATRQGPIARWRYRCAPGRTVELVLVADNGHAWPGGKPGSRRGDTPSTAYNATDAIWSFFRAHAK